jgi:uncharacterized membrane protein
MPDLPQPSKPAQARLDSVDFLRGVVIVLMALDHVKGHFAIRGGSFFVELNETYPAAFFTRWVTHFCAPVFVFLAGTGAFLYGARGRSKSELAWFLLSRGFWLVFLELTVVRLAWYLDVNYAASVGQVIWAIGWSMVVLSGLVYLPISMIAVFSVAMIAGHNLTDNISRDSWGDYGWVWSILHTGEPISLGNGMMFHPLYPLIPWIGVLSAGYCFGALMLLEPAQRRKEVFGLGVALTLLFIVLRYSNVYGDRAVPVPAAGQPGPWSIHEDWQFTVMSFVNCQKYPPSLDFLLMTLGPALMVLALADRQREPGPITRFFVIFGRVPLFFYLLHWYVLKGLMIGLAYLRYGNTDWPLGTTAQPSDFGYDLAIVYLIWIGVVLFFYPLCLWFAAVKRRSPAAWLRYL